MPFCLVPPMMAAANLLSLNPSYALCSLPPLRVWREKQPVTSP